jgi:hypothetical protein
MNQQDPTDTASGIWLRRLTHQAPATAVVPLPRKIGLRASISEFLLVTKLRARNLLGRRDQTVVKSDEDQAAIMARFSHILDVTCKQWFPRDTPARRQHHPRL